jgi:hypothetical protein
VGRTPRSAADPLVRLLYLSLILLPTPAARADGGSVLLHQQSGEFIITVFSAPSDISVMIQDRASLQPILDAAVSIHFTRAAAPESLVRLTRQQAQNKLLYAAPVALPEPGTWSFTVDVKRGSSHAVASGALIVAPPAMTLASNWGYLALPPIFIAIFAIRERLVRHRG